MNKELVTKALMTLLETAGDDIENMAPGVIRCAVEEETKGFSPEDHAELSVMLGDIFWAVATRYAEATIKNNPGAIALWGMAMASIGLVKNQTDVVSGVVPNPKTLEAANLLISKVKKHLVAVMAKDACGLEN